MSKPKSEELRRAMSMKIAPGFKVHGASGPHYDWRSADEMCTF